MSTLTAREIVATGFRIRRIIIACLILPPVIAIAFSFIVTPIYMARSSVLVKTGREYQEHADVGEAATSGLSSTKQEAVNSEIEIILSSAVAEETINRIGAASLSGTAPQRPMGMIVDAFLKTVNAEPVKQSNIIEITINNPNRELAIRTLNTLLAVYLERHVEVFSEPRSKYLESQVETTVTDLTALEERREAIRTSFNIYAIDAQRIALIQQRADANKSQSGIASELEATRRRVEELHRARAKVNGVEISVEDAQNDALVFANNQMTQLRLTRDQLLARWPAGDRRIRDINTQIHVIERSVSALQEPPHKVRTQPSALAARLDQDIILAEAEMPALVARKDAADRLVGSATTDLNRLEGADRELHSIDRQIDAIQQTLRTYRQRLSEARLQEQLDRERVASVRIIQPATALSTPVKPKKMVYALMGLLGSMVAAAAALITALTFQNTFVTAEAIERILGVPVLVSVRRRTVPGQPGTGFAAGLQGQPT